MNRLFPFDIPFEFPVRPESMLTAPHRFLAKVTEDFRVFPLSVRKNEKEMVFDVEVPGLRLEDIDITFDKGVLELVFRRRAEQAHDDVIFQERSTSSEEVRRRFQLGNDLDAENISAHLEHGMLHIVLPYKARPEPQKINIKTITPSES